MSKAEPIKRAEEPVSGARSRLTMLLEQTVTGDGIHTTAIPRLFLVRASQPTLPFHSIFQPALCLIAQGRRLVMLMGSSFLYGPEQCLVASVELPASGQVIEATPEVPFLGLRLDLEPGQLGALMLETGLDAADDLHPAAGLALTPVGPELLDAAVRLVRLLETPRDIPVLAPLFVREILYRLLSSEQAACLRRIGLADHRLHSVSRAISWLKENYSEPFRIESVARFAHMSPSALFHNFKAVTTMSPLQYQKQLRLQEARRLMMGENFDAATAGYSVGYESPSQFNREYKRLFGAPPARDIAQLKIESGRY